MPEFDGDDKIRIEAMMTTMTERRRWVGPWRLVENGGQRQWVRDYEESQETGTGSLHVPVAGGGGHLASAFVGGGAGGGAGSVGRGGGGAGGGISEARMVRRFFGVVVPPRPWPFSVEVDQRERMMYVRLAEGTIVSTASVEVAGVTMNVDCDEHGRALGVELY